MPLSAPVERDLLHTRDIQVRGYHRADGLFDIEATLIDTKSFGFDSIDRGHIDPGEPLHGMHMRITIDDTMLIVASEASTEYGPFNVCGGGAAAYSRLAGLTIKSGFLKAANERLGGSVGCTHQRELLQQLATIAFQTMWPVRSKREAAALEARRQSGEDVTGTPSNADGSKRLLNTCFAYASSSPVVERRWPHLYTGPDERHGKPSDGSGGISLGVTVQPRAHIA